jgi:hypothetical protein
MELHRTLSPEEEKEFRKWARENYVPGTSEISQVWHPVVIHEIGVMHLEKYERQKQKDGD